MKTTSWCFSNFTQYNTTHMRNFKNNGNEYFFLGGKERIVKTKLMPFQKEGIEKLMEFDCRALLADEQGLGKTIQLLSLYKKLYGKSDKTKPFLVICPSSLKLNWQKEAFERFNIPSIILEGKKPCTKTIRKVFNNDLPPMVIINYDILQGWVDCLAKFDWGIVFMDESHYIKTWDSGRTKAARKLILLLDNLCITKHNRRLFLICASGTPLTNQPPDLFSTLSLLKPTTYNSYMGFCTRYSNRTQFGFKGGKNMEELHKVLSGSIMVRRLKKDVLQDLPNKVHTTIPVEIDKREYNQAKIQFLSWLRQKGYDDAKIARSMNAEVIVQINALLQIVRQYKEEGVVRYIKDFLEESDKKLVIFTRWKADIALLRKHFPDNSVYIDGSCTTQHRHQAVESFQKNDKVRLFFGNIKAAGVGLTLTAASDELFLALPWTPADLNQAIDRCHRIGQKESVNIKYLIAKGTIEEDISKILMEKQRVFEKIIDNKEGERYFDNEASEGINLSELVEALQNS